MATVGHKTLTGTELHVAGYLQGGDPGAVGVGIYWIDSSAGAGLWVLKVRNATDTDWEVIASGGGSSANTYRLAFTDATLAAGVLSVNHALAQKYVNVLIYDENDQAIVSPDNITLTDTNNLTIDLSSFGTLSGTWNVVVNS